MSIFSSFKKINRLIAKLEKPPKDLKLDNCYGYYEVETIITEIESIGDPTALTSLIAKQKQMEEHLILFSSFSYSPKMKENYQFLYALEKKTRRVIDIFERKINNKT